MLTNTKRNPLSLMLILLVLLSLTAIAPLIGKSFAMASETPEMVDNNINYVNQNEQKIDENQVDPEELDEEKNNLEDDSEEKDTEKKEEGSDADLEETASNEKTEDGFPVSYQPLLDELKAEHPNWKFVAADTGVSWKEALDEEDEGSRNLVDPSVSKKQRENSDKTYDGRWYRANRKTIAHYMDPRNFLNENEIYQFLVQSYEDGAQSTETVEDIIDGSFMEDANPGGGYDSYAECICDAGREAGVNPNVLAAMIIMEQGWDGSSLVSGEKKGYKGYYNFFNIGAWTTDSMSSVERGLWYAKGEGEDNTSYGRPWDSPYKAIVGGAQFYKENYISEHQNTYYTKKYNVMNGLSVMGDHQYMTNVSGGLDEGKLVRKAYESNDGMSLTFEIPVYDDMPEEFCKLPE